ncbi:uncharacterized protein LOC135096342 isoform X3 [Scylla paramamosain]|uniref:uncharacterized protein LOC135096342 isoform X3 n=1 Tax=Scylla paramamosain TaxID=85552 RepID=UPI003083D275
MWRQIRLGQVMVEMTCLSSYSEVTSQKSIGHLSCLALIEVMWAAVKELKHHSAPEEWHPSEGSVLASGVEDDAIFQWDLAVEREAAEEGEISLHRSRASSSTRAALPERLPRLGSLSDPQQQSAFLIFPGRGGGEEGTADP